MPLRNLLKETNYACYRLRTESSPGTRGRAEDYPCFVHRDGEEQETLWGATYRIVMDFLEIVCGFRPPPIETLPVIHGTLSKNYRTGEGKTRAEPTGG